MPRLNIQDPRLYYIFVSLFYLITTRLASVDALLGRSRTINTLISSITAEVPREYLYLPPTFLGIAVPYFVRLADGCMRY